MSTGFELSLFMSTIPTTVTLNIRRHKPRLTATSAGYLSARPSLSRHNRRSE
jgi:hypothetical protein